MPQPQFTLEKSSNTSKFKTLNVFIYRYWSFQLLHTTLDNRIVMALYP